MRGVLFSAKAEYACLAMLELAARHGDPQPTPLKSIAERHGIPERFLVQILLQLKGAGLVASTRGAAGGYQLTRPPGQITLADVIGVLDGDVTPPTDSPTARPASA
ncbi:MAG TPA: Rrf2 family transcriptional regulator, partial [Gemmataceae bacterium]